MAEDVQQQVITEVEAMRFLRSALAHPRCSRCNADMLDVVTRENGEVAQLRLVASAVSFFPLVVYVCNNCGQLEQFSWATVWEWVQKASRDQA